MRVGLYVRVSTQEAKKHGYSIGEQESRLKKYCDAKDWDVYRVYVDGGYSGATTDRPALQDAIKDVEDHRIDAILVNKLDRLSRSQKDTLELIEDVFLPNRVDFVSMTENFDTTTPFGMAMVGLLSVFAQLERAQIKERMAIGQLGRAKAGKYHGNHKSPIGFRYVNDQLHIIEYEAMMLREAFGMFNRRVSINRICNDFAEKGYKHRYGYFLPSSMRKTLRNPIYAGYIEKDGELYEGQHEAIVSREAFSNTQRIFDERDKDNPNRKTAFKRNSLLGGMIYCKNCGSKYCKTLGHRKKDGTKSRFYTCNSRNKKNPSRVIDPNCRNKIYRMEELDAAIIEEVTKLSIDPAYIDTIREVKDDSEKPKRIELIKKRVDEISTQISRYTDLYSLGSLDIDEVKGKIDPLAAERTSLNAELRSLQKVNDSATEQIAEHSLSFGEFLENGDIENARFALEELIDKIVIDNERIDIFWTCSYEPPFVPVFSLSPQSVRILKDGATTVT